MLYRTLGGSGIEASAVALGAWAIGGWMWGEQDDRESIRAIHAALDEEINFIDTAPMYGYGRSEEIVGKAIRGRRDRVVLATKCGLSWEGDEPRQGQYHFSADEKGIRRKDSATHHVYRNLKPESVRRELEDSLRRLGVEWVDLYQTHWQDGTTPIEETMEVLVSLKKEGKIRAIGASNASVDLLREYSAAGGLDADQEKYSMLDRGLEGDNLPFCREQNIAFLAYSPLANGLLTGKIGPEREFEEGDLRRENPRFSVENRQRIEALLRQLRPLAEAHGLTLAQLVIAWTYSQPGVSHALVGIRTEEQARSNAAAGRARLSEDDLAAVEEALEEFE